MVMERVDVVEAIKWKKKLSFTTQEWLNYKVNKSASSLAPSRVYTNTIHMCQMTKILHFDFKTEYPVYFYISVKYLFMSAIHQSAKYILNDAINYQKLCAWECLTRESAVVIC